MGEQKSQITGATLERGQIAEVTANGYRVANLDRNGLKSREITGIDDTEYAVNDLVLFCMFTDGGGKIFCKL